MQALAFKLCREFADLVHGSPIAIADRQVRQQHVAPSLGSEVLKNAQRVFFVEDLFEFVPSVGVRQCLDMAFLFAVVVAALGTLLQGPPQTFAEARCTEQQGGLLNESVGGNETKLAILDIRDAIQGIKQQSIGALIQGDSHGIGGEVPPPQVIQDDG